MEGRRQARAGPCGAVLIVELQAGETVRLAARAMTNRWLRELRDALAAGTWPVAGRRGM